jgi:primosomal protein N' (replication factor Y)
VFAEIILFLPLDQSFFYIVPPEQFTKVKVGSRVLGPFRRKKMTGIVIGLRKTNPGFSFELKTIDQLLDEKPVFSDSFLSFARKMSLYFHCSWGELLHVALPPSFVVKSTKVISLTPLGKKKMEDSALTQEERDILGFVNDRSYSEAYIKKNLNPANLPARLIRMENKGLLRVQDGIKKTVQRRKEDRKRSATQLEMDFSLDGSLHSVAGRISLSILKGKASFYMIHGPDWKRESIYLELIRAALDGGKKVLLLLPEISLTEVLVIKLEKKLGVDISVLHSMLTERKREIEWGRVLSGETKVVLGTRSSLLVPLKDLGLIIVDDEQDDSYLQQENPVFDARIGACIRAEHSSAAVVYGSEAPSVETYYRAREKDAVFNLGKRKSFVNIKIVDVSGERSFISKNTIKAVGLRLERGKQVLVFLNRLGYASYLVCSHCRYIPRCPKCGISLAFHKGENKLICHYCQFSKLPSRSCPECGTGILRKHGMGIEVLEEEFQRLFPEHRVNSFSAAVTKNKKEKERILAKFRKGEIDILVGTQLLAHCFDLPRVVLAVVIAPESLLALSDFQAAQKTFQYLNRLKGLVKNESGSEFLIQTSLPDHYAVRCFSEEDYMAFYAEEMEYRKLMEYPPFTHMAEVLLAAENPRSLSRVSRRVFSVLAGREKIDVLGPSKVAWAKIRGRHRVQIIVKSRSKQRLDDALKEALQNIKVRKKVFLYG